MFVLLKRTKSNNNFSTNFYVPSNLDYLLISDWLGKFSRVKNFLLSFVKWADVTGIVCSLIDSLDIIWQELVFVSCWEAECNFLTYWVIYLSSDLSVSRLLFKSYTFCFWLLAQNASFSSPVRRSLVLLFFNIDTTCDTSLLKLVFPVILEQPVPFGIESSCNLRFLIFSASTTIDFLLSSSTF